LQHFCGSARIRQVGNQRRYSHTLHQFFPFQSVSVAAAFPEWPWPESPIIKIAHNATAASVAFSTLDNFDYFIDVVQGDNVAF